MFILKNAIVLHNHWFRIAGVGASRISLCLSLSLHLSICLLLQSLRITQIAGNNYQAVGISYTCAEFKSKAEIWQLL